MNLTKILIWLVFHVATVLSSPLPNRQCRKNVQTKKALEHILDTFLIVDNALVGKDAEIRKVLGINPRRRRDLANKPAIQGSSDCPWKWKTTKTRPHEVPNKFQRAFCPGCGHFCRPVEYHFRVLVKDGSDSVSGASVWRWKVRTVPIAYVYNKEAQYP